MKLTDHFLEVVKHEGIVSIVSWGADEPHIVNTWNSYMVITEDERILIPAAGMRKTQKNIEINPKVKLTLGTKEVLGVRNTPGTGFMIDGNASFLEAGTEFDMMFKKFPFLSRVLEITLTSLKQTL